MASLAEFTIGVTRKFGLGRIDGDDLDGPFVQQQIEFAAPGLADPRLMTIDVSTRVAPSQTVADQRCAPLKSRSRPIA